jgi:membrane associated rhomboid family serine protease
MIFAAGVCEDILGVSVAPGQLATYSTHETSVGIYDRPYYGGNESTGGLAAFKSQPMVVKIIIVNAIIFFIDVFTPATPTHGHWLSDMMAVRPDDLFVPLHWWKFLTAGFAHSPLDGARGPWHLAWNMYSLWLFGRDVEGKYGSREFLRFYLSFIVIASIAWAVVQRIVQPGSQTQMYGASGAVAGVLVLFALNFPQRKFLLLFVPFAVPAWALAVLFIGGDIWGAAGMREGNVAFSAHLAGAAAALCYYFSNLRLDQWLNFGSGRSPRITKRKNLKVFSPSSTTEDLDRQADKILAKLNASGVESLSAKERKILDAYSRRMKQKHR